MKAENRIDLDYISNLRVRIESETWDDAYIAHL